MTTRKEIKRLLKKGLTGKEAARLILQDSWLVDRNRPGFLSQGDIQAIKDSLNEPEQIRDYNKWIETYRLIDYSLKEAELLAMTITRRLFEQLPLIGRYVFEYRLNIARQWFIPKVVTEKQYQNIQQEQREDKLRELNNLAELLDRLTFDLASSQRHQWDGDEDEDRYLFEYLREDHPETWQQIIDTILEPVKAGDLQFSTLSQKDLDAIVEIDNEGQDAWREYLEAHPEIKILDGSNLKTEEEESQYKKQMRDFFEFKEPYYKRQEIYKEEAYERAKQSQTEEQRAQIIEILEKLKTEDTTEDEDNVLDNTYCREEDLYELVDIPGIRKFIDEFDPAMDGPQYYAIIQDPPEDMLDERGYWVEEWPELLSGLDILREDWKEKHPESLEEFLETMHTAVKAQLCNFLAGQKLVEVVSELIGVPFAEDFKKWERDIKNVVAIYNGYLEKASKGYKGRKLELPELDITSLRPDPGELEYLKERIAIAQGAEWIEEANEILLRSYKPEDRPPGPPEPEEESEVEAFIQQALQELGEEA